MPERMAVRQLSATFSQRNTAESGGMDETPRERLANAMANRRRELRLSVRAAAQRAGVDRATWSSAETATRQIAEYNYAGVEAALDWQPGSVDQILAGGTATPRPAGTTPTTAAQRDDVLEIVANDPDLDAQMKYEITKLIVARRESTRAAEIDEVSRLIDLFKQRRGA
jgi:hypothetical protein